MKYLTILLLIFGLFIVFSNSNKVEAKSYIRSYTRSSGIKVKSYTRYKADGYKFNNYVYRSDRGYRK